MQSFAPKGSRFLLVQCVPTDTGIRRNEPALITRVTRVEVVPYNQVTAEYAAIEGEACTEFVYAYRRRDD